MSIKQYIPHTGYDPMDGEEPHMTLSPDNPVRVIDDKECCGDIAIKDFPCVDCPFETGVKI